MKIEHLPNRQLRKICIELGYVDIFLGVENSINFLKGLYDVEIMKSNPNLDVIKNRWEMEIYKILHSDIHFKSGDQYLEFLLRVGHLIIKMEYL